MLSSEFNILRVKGEIISLRVWKTNKRIQIFPGFALFSIVVIILVLAEYGPIQWLGTFMIVVTCNLLGCKL